MSAEQVHVGRLVAERYRLDELLGRGGYGSVYKGWDTHVGRDVAVKLLDLGDGTRTREQIVELRERFRREAQAAQKINHRGVVKVFDFGVPEEGESFLVMELLSGRDLSDELALKGPMSPERVQRLFVPLLEGLGVGHSLGIVHKDIKPQNVFLCDPEGQAEALCLVDFGVARVMHEHKLTVTGLIVGTPQYLAPEYVTDALVTPALDVYQMGLILVEMITGKPAIPFGETFVKSCNRHFIGDLDIPEELFDGQFGEVLRAALAANPTQRIQSASEFAQRLGAVDPSTIAIPFRPTMVFSRDEVWRATTAPLEFAPMSPAEISAELQRESGAIVAPPVVTPLPSAQIPATAEVRAAPAPTAQVPGTAPIRHAQPLLPVLPPPVEPPAPPSKTTSPWMVIIASLLVLGLLVGGLVLAIVRPQVPQNVPRVDTVEAAPTPAPLEIELEAPASVPIVSKPPGARILLDGVEIGVTPGAVEVGRASTVELRLEGYEPARVAVVEGAPAVTLQPLPVQKESSPTDTKPKPPPPRDRQNSSFAGKPFDPEKVELPEDPVAAPEEPATEPSAPVAPTRPEKFGQPGATRWDR